MTVTISRADQWGRRCVRWINASGQRCAAYRRGILAAWQLASALRRGDESLLRY